MINYMPCPVCSGDVEIHALATGKEAARCYGCAIGLVRFPEHSDPGWRVDRLDLSPKQCRARLEALANHLDLEFEAPEPQAAGVLRVHLWVKREDKRGPRTARVNGGGHTEGEALVAAIADAERLELL